MGKDKQETVPLNSPARLTIAHESCELPTPESATEVTATILEIYHGVQNNAESMKNLIQHDFPSQRKS